DPIRVSRQRDHVFTTDGTPADCVRVALDHVAPDVDWVLAGINHGGNLGADVFMSGTVAAVREGVLHGKPGIAASYYHKKGLDPLNWERATRWLTPILRDLTSRPWLPGSLWNINLPHLMNDSAEPAIEFCDLDPSPLPVRYRTEDGALHYAGNYHERQRHPGSDVDRCFAGRITISLVKLY
ncbi:MAG: 5'/3'-nucleotidase SurE, partial [Planctomycetota bacterium]|nr:5'/3'-nucleotidase SurE [Planctomycetota bacterium]